jgi:predicted Zn finger-like uncharacterized protein
MLDKPSGLGPFMAILCPSCAARQTISEDAIGHGRMLHCDWCGTRWIARPFVENPYRHTASVAEPEEVSDAIVIEDIAPGRSHHPAARKPARTPVPFPADRRWLKGLGIGLAVVAAVFALGVPLVAALPQKGLPDAVEKLAFQRVHSETMVRNGVKTLLVEGELVNTSGGDVAVPAIRVSLRSPAGAEVYSWLVEPTKAGLAPGRSIGFRSAVSAPPVDANQVTLRLAQRENQIIGMR